MKSTVKMSPLKYGPKNFKLLIEKCSLQFLFNRMQNGFLWENIFLSLYERGEENEGSIFSSKYSIEVAIIGFLRVESNKLC